jgi:hypothetical protein
MQTLMTRGRTLMTIALIAVLTGCRKQAPADTTAPVDPALRDYREKVQSRIAMAQLEMLRFHDMTDAQMVSGHQKDGLGFGIRLEKTELHVGEPLKVHLALENVAAHGPISATTCEGFSLAEEDSTTGVTTAVSITFACNHEDPLRDNNLALRQGELKTADIVVDKTRLSFDHPGRYLLNAGWQTFHPRDGLFQRGDEYSSMPSNLMLITVR